MTATPALMISAQTERVLLHLFHADQVMDVVQVDAVIRAIVIAHNVLLLIKLQYVMMEIRAQLTSAKAEYVLTLQLQIVALLLLNAAMEMHAPAIFVYPIYVIILQSAIAVPLIPNVMMEIRAQ